MVIQITYAWIQLHIDTSCRYPYPTQTINHRWGKKYI